MFSHSPAADPKPAAPVWSALVEKSRSWLSLEKTAEKRGAKIAAVASGVALLDKILPEGLPTAGFTEVLSSAAGRPEFRLMLAAAARLGSCVWVLPAEGFEPFAPAFEAAGVDLTRQLFVVPPSPEAAFEAAREAAASGEARAVFAWLPPLAPEADRRAVRRLALAAGTCGTAVYAVRPAALACLPAAGMLRLQLTPADRTTLRVRVLKRGTYRTHAAECVVPLADFVEQAAPGENNAKKTNKANTADAAAREPSLFPDPVFAA